MRPALHTEYPVVTKLNCGYRIASTVPNHLGPNIYNTRPVRATNYMHGLPRDTHPEGCGTQMGLSSCGLDTCSSTCLLHILDSAVRPIRQRTAPSINIPFSPLRLSHIELKKKKKGTKLIPIKHNQIVLFLQSLVGKAFEIFFFSLLFDGSQPSTVPERDARSFCQRAVCLDQRRRRIRGR